MLCLNLLNIPEINITTLINQSLWKVLLHRLQ